MAITVRRLLARTDLGLRLLTPSHSGLDEPISWVAGTDLPDPTPFVGEGNIVLTTGQQFGGLTDAESYARRLAGAGIRAVGFGSDVVSTVPDTLVDACTTIGMPLFEVPYRTPFLAVVRYVADLVTAAAQARGAWALGAQRAIALAAMHDDGIRRAVAELSRQLGSPVALFDARGRMSVVEGEDGDTVFGDSVADEIARLLARGARAASTTPDGTELQTVGRGGELRGVLAVAGHLDAAAHGVVAAVLALAALALEQRRTLGAAEESLRSGAWRALIHGDSELASQLAADAGAHLPERFQVCVFRATRTADLPSLGDRFTARDGQLTIILEPDAGRVEDLRSLAGAPVGVSGQVARAHAAEGFRHASLAHSRAEQEGGTVTYDSVADEGFAAVLDTDDARAIGASLLRQIADQYERQGSAFILSLRAWLEHNGQWDPAATALGIHRHTMRNRIRQIERLTGRDLASARTRADYVLALGL